ncbi:MAG: exodeoxyribonuclease VII large subunit [Planctomycetota bacterium]
MDWNADLGRIVLSFSYDKMLIEEVKSIAGRKWHRDHKFWSVPLESAGEAARVLIPLGFETAKDLEKLLTGEVEGLAGMARSATDPAPDPGDPQADGWTVSRLNETVREALQLSVPRSIWLVGEVLEFDRNQHRENIFFRIVEKQQDDDKPRASVTAIIWQGQRQKVLDRFAETGSDLEDGLQIRIKVRVDLYVGTGSFQVVVEDIDPSYTLGEIARRRERILAEIRKKGLTDQNQSLPWPEIPLRIGVITSPGSDAWKDLIDELANSGFSFDVSLFGVHVQGERTEQDVLTALSYFEQRATDYDVVLLIRGGGSRADLLAFDSLPLAVAVAQHPLKIVIGIGHQADRSVLDELAHSEKTPTAVGQLLIQRVSDSWLTIRDRVARIMLSASRSLQTLNSDLQWLQSRVSQGIELAVSEQKRSLQARAGTLKSSAFGQIGEVRGGLRAERDRLISGGWRSLRIQQDRWQRTSESLRHCAHQSFAREQERWSARNGQLRAADPMRILSRGFAWVRGESGKTIRSIGDSKTGEMLEVQIRDGVIDARVERSRKDPPAGLSH